MEGGAPSGRSVTQIWAAAVLRNPWLGTGTDEDLTPGSARTAPTVATLLADRVLERAGGAGSVCAFGKAALIGLGGEYEHGGALVHTPYFGNLVREYTEGSSIICFSDERATAGESLSVPMWHKTAAATRDYYQTVNVRIPDAPRPDEIAVVLAVSTGPRPHARIGDRSSDPEVTSSTLEKLEKERTS